MSTSIRSIELTIVYEPVENGWFQARIAELPSVVTAAPSRQEPRRMLDALREYLRSLAGDPLDLEGEREPAVLTITA